MRFLYNLSIRRKQTLIIMLTSTITLLLAGGAFLAVEARNFRSELSEEISTMTQVAGDNCTAALDFNVPKEAEDTLAALRAETPIANACIYDEQGKVFAEYQRGGSTNKVKYPPVQPPGREFRDQQLRIFQAITVRGNKIGTIYVNCDLYELNDRLKGFAMMAALVLGISWLVAFFLSMRLQRVISGPILQLAHVVRAVTLEKNYAVRATKHSNDELGQLMDGFNEMLVQIQARDLALQTARDNLEKRVQERTQELEMIHKQLVDASRRGGMAEIASNVLHNVGNVLNSVNISTNLLVEKVKKSKTPGLVRVTNLLEQHTHDLGDFITMDSRGKHLPAHLRDLAECLMADQGTILAELESLRRNVEHIKEIVAMQQSYAKVGGVKEMINLKDLVEDGLCINEGGLRRHGVEIVREFEQVPQMNVEKHKILQILVNLFRNAKYACEESDRADKRLTVRMANGDGRVRISVIDNGVGIPAENMTRIFNHGFTTRKDGHGFGLHSGALAAKEMGGSLSAHSDGPCKGATFTLELPSSARQNSNE
jgi:two-component system, NtrC family, sensor kinase